MALYSIMVAETYQLRFQPLGFYAAGEVSGYYGFFGGIRATMDMHILVRI